MRVHVRIGFKRRFHRHARQAVEELPLFSLRFSSTKYIARLQSCCRPVRKREIAHSYVFFCALRLPRMRLSRSGPPIVLPSAQTAAATSTLSGNGRPTTWPRGRERVFSFAIGGCP